MGWSTVREGLGEGFRVCRETPTWRVEGGLGDSEVSKERSACHVGRLGRGRHWKRKLKMPLSKRPDKGKGGGGGGVIRGGRGVRKTKATSRHTRKRLRGGGKFLRARVLVEERGEAPKQEDPLATSRPETKICARLVTSRGSQFVRRGSGGKNRLTAKKNKSGKGSKRTRRTRKSGGEKSQERNSTTHGEKREEEIRIKGLRTKRKQQHGGSVL